MHGGGRVNGAAALENSLTVFNKVKGILAVHSRSWGFTQEK